MGDPTAWGAYNAVDYWLEHEARAFKSAETRWESVVTGEVASLKAGAFQALAGAAA